MKSNIYMSCLIYIDEYNIIQFYLFIIYWTIVDYHMCAFIICSRQNKESEKGLLNTNKQKTNTRTYVNLRWYANKNKELNNYWIYLNA